MDDYYLELVTKTPIRYQEISFYPITLKEIITNIGFNLFEKMLYPFCVTIDNFQLEGKQRDGFNLFEDIILKDRTLLLSVVYILKLFCKQENIKISDNTIEFYENAKVIFTIDRHNFEQISEIIRKLNVKKIIKVEKMPTNLTERQKDIWIKLHEGRKRASNKSELHIYDIINICEYGGNYHIPLEEIMSFTPWKLMNCYSAKIVTKTYDDNLTLCSISYDAKSISNNNHWSKQLMIHE